MPIDQGLSIKIYGFFTLEQDGSMAFFYVGRSRDLERRVREHSRSKAKGHEDKYVRMRELDAANVPYHSEVIETVGDEDYFPDAERWHVIRLTRAGHTLTNMRHGSVEHRQQLAEQINARHIRSAADVRSDREHREQMRKYRASRKLQRAIWNAELLERGIPDLAKDRLLPGVFRRKLLAYYKAYANADTVCLRPMSVQYLCFLALSPLSEAGRFRELETSFQQAGHFRLTARRNPSPYVVEEPRNWEGEDRRLTVKERGAKRTRLRAIKQAQKARLRSAWPQETRAKL